MTTVADLVRVMHDIDELKGRTCYVCAFSVWNYIGSKRWMACHFGYATAGPNDGCDDWQAKSDQEHAA